VKEKLNANVLTYEFLRNVGIINPEVSFLNKLKIVNDELRIKGVSTDIDDSEVNSHTEALRGFNSSNNTNRTNEELTDRFIMVKWLEELGSENPLEHAIGFWNSIEQMPHLEATPGADIVYKYLHDIGIPMHRSTARPGWTREATLLWYTNNASYVDLSLIHIQEGNDINPSFKTNTIINKIKAGYHFEDAPEESEVLASAGVIVGLVPQTWNENYKPVSPRIVTVSKALEHGLPNLGLDAGTFREVPKIAQVYFALNEYILEAKIK